MESGGAGGFHGYRLGPRIPVPPVDDPVLRLRHDIKFAATMTTSDVPSRIMARADATTSTGSSQCSEGSTSNLCEKPIGSQSMTIPIVLGIA